MKNFARILGVLGLSIGSLTGLPTTSAAPLDTRSVTIDGAEGLPPHVQDSLRTIAAAAGERRIAVTSKQRTVRKQVELVIDYYIECNAADRSTSRRKEAGQCGVQEALRVYDADCEGPLALYRRDVSREANVATITAKLTETLTALGDSRTCMVHVALPGITLQNIAVDIAPSSVQDPARFYDAVMNHSAVSQERFFYPSISGKPRSTVADSAFHLEFSRE